MPHWRALSSTRSAGSAVPDGTPTGINMKFTSITTRVATLAALLAALCTLGAAPVLAQVYANPLPYLKTAGLAGGLEYNSFGRKLKADGANTSSDATLTRTDVHVEYGMADDLGLDGYLGTANFHTSGGGGGISGTEFGVGARKAMGRMGETLDTAITAAVRSGSISNNDLSGSFTQLDVTYGAATKVDDNISAYAGVVLSKLDVTLKSDALNAEAKFEGDSLLGVYGGAEYAPKGKRYRAGVELHLVHESGFGFYGLMSF